MLQVPRPPLAHQPSALAVQPVTATEAAAINATLTELKPVQGMFNQTYIPAAYGQYNNSKSSYPRSRAIDGGGAVWEVTVGSYTGIYIRVAGRYSKFITI